MALRILVVDDKKHWRDELESQLSLRGYTAEVCSSAPEAVDIVGRSATPFDLVVTDMRLEGEPGDWLVSQILSRNEYNRRPAIICVTNDPHYEIDFRLQYGIENLGERGRIHFVLKDQPETFYQRLKIVEEFLIQMSDRPHVKIVHAGQPTEKEWQKLKLYRKWPSVTNCNPLETVQDVVVLGKMSLRECGKQVPDPLRRKDFYVFDYMARYSCRGFRFSADSLAKRIGNPDFYIFWDHVEEDRFDPSFDATSAKNAVKRLRGSFTKAGLDGDKVIVEEDGEYYIDADVTVDHFSA